MRYLVTGGAGFIGSHLVESLQSRGDTAVVLDNLSTGKSGNLGAGAELIVGDISDPGVVDEVFARIDGCFHLAAIASVQQYATAWERSVRTNLLGSVVVLEAAARHNVPLVYASSAAVYGDNSETPLIETALSHPISGYGVDKLGLELHAGAMQTALALRAVGMRFFNVFGPRQAPGSPYSGVISIFLERLLAHQPLLLFGDGEQSRDFVYVSDIAESLICAMGYASVGNSGVFNICSGIPTTINLLAASIGQLLDVEVKKDFLPSRAGDIRVSLGNPRHASESLGFQTGVSLQDGLRRTASWFRAPNPVI